jgi:two-component system sensor histidine kinase/response regulator
MNALNDLRPGRILIVDDDDLVRQTLLSYFSARGFDTVECNDPHAALQRTDLASFNLLITDLQMPAMDGIELIRRAQGAHPDLAAILVTGHASIENAIEAMRSGAVDVVQKPFKFSALLSTVQRAMETQQLRLANRRLQAEVRDRVAQLEAVNQELDAFAARLAHDLRGPVNNMRGIVAFMLEELGPAADAELRDLMQRGVKSGDQALKMVSDLLDFARLGNRAMALEPVDLNTVVAQVLAGLDTPLPSAQCRLNTQGLGRVMGHPGLLQQVMANLIANAQKFSAARPVIHIDITGHDTGDGMHELHVRDNGVGFDPAHAHQLFKPFQRLHPQAEFTGQGMGLANVKRIVERHGGTVSAASVPGEGAVFTLRLKAAPA